MFGGLVQYSAAGQLLKHRLRQLSDTIRTFPLIWFPDTATILLKKWVSTQVAPFSHSTLLKPILVATAL